MWDLVLIFLLTGLGYVVFMLLVVGISRFSQYQEEKRAKKEKR
ncbi:MAG: hypothetical protein UY40_C0007G0011 [candidate division CPR1 bacterium GW2011_GWC1_49_13]|uniref:Uncharacterized protein n=1 Tax=candidate division CPR1 bacterium GW2011_GWC1_49_13 TaxID=1618342 RepID=A0A0G1XTF6_9BACT|nr:MAG: hypothetical protein UY40_C0007G0011 [candidate division CPR1 bacterium GW2011_GWC1_49_13]